MTCEVSDHAILRFLERAYGLDVESVKAEMMKGIEPAVAFGARVVIVHGVRLVIRDGRSCVTALPKGRHAHG
jgi:predicted Ser/Thr protein kinase